MVIINILAVTVAVSKKIVTKQFLESVPTFTVAGNDNLSHCSQLR